MVLRRTVGRINSTVLRKGANMPKKPVIKEIERYMVIWQSGDTQHWTEYANARLAVDGYRYMRKLFGDNVRMVKVVFDYGQEV